MSKKSENHRIKFYENLSIRSYLVYWYIHVTCLIFYSNPIPEVIKLYKLSVGFNLLFGFKSDKQIVLSFADIKSDTITLTGWTARVLTQRLQSKECKK